MILNKTHGFLFVHVPKTAGMAITRSLSQFTTPQDMQLCPPLDEINRRYAETYGLKKHSTAAEIRTAVGNELFDPLFKFAVVRDPYARAFSLFRYLKLNWRKWQGSDIMDTFDTFDAFIASDFFQSSGPDRLFSPQAFWLTDARDQLMVDRVARMEDLESELRQIYAAIGLPPLPKVRPVNASGRRGLLAKVAGRIPIVRSFRLFPVPIARPDLCQIYSSERTRRIVADRYARDFEMFGYSPELSPGRSGN